MTQTDERLARLETKMDAAGATLAGIESKLDGRLAELEKTVTTLRVDTARLKLQAKWVAGIISVPGAGVALYAAALRLMGGP